MNFSSNMWMKTIRNTTPSHFADFLFIIIIIIIIITVY